MAEQLDLFAGPPAPPDQASRDRVTDELGTTLFVAAGAGSGKTTALVGRVVNLVTSAACRSPRSRRSRSPRRRPPSCATASASRCSADVPARGAVELARRAVLDVDHAPIGTLHAFARRLLSRVPGRVAAPAAVRRARRGPERHRVRRALGRLPRGAARRPGRGAPRRAVRPTTSSRSTSAHDGWPTTSSPTGTSSPSASTRSCRARHEPAIDDAAPPLRRDRPASTPRRTTRQHDDRPRHRADRDASARRARRSATCSASWASSTDSDVTDGNKTNWKRSAAADGSTSCVRGARPRRRRPGAAERVQRRTTAHPRRAATRVHPRRGRGTPRRRPARVPRPARVRPRALAPDHADGPRRLHHRYTRLLLDEFQDTDPIQLELAVRITADPDDRGRLRPAATAAGPVVRRRRREAEHLPLPSCRHRPVHGRRAVDRRDAGDAVGELPQHPGRDRLGQPHDGRADHRRSRRASRDYEPLDRLPRRCRPSRLGHRARCRGAHRQDRRRLAARAARPPTSPT